METVHASNEHTPLLGNDVTPNEHARLTRSFVTFIRQTSSDGDESTSNGDDAASNLDARDVVISGQTVHASNEHAPLLGNDVTPNEHAQLTRSFATFIRQTSSDGNESTSNGDDAASNLDARDVVISVPGNVNQETDDVSIEEITQALFSVWEQNRQSGDIITLEFFTEKELYLLHLAWKKVTRGRNCNLEPRRIAEALAAAIIAGMFPRPESPDSNYSDFNFYLHADEHLLTVNVLSNWEKIAEGHGFPLRYTRTIFESDEHTPAVSEFWIRQVDLYDKIHDFILNSSFQVILQILLIIWPISILLVGAKYMNCPMGHQLAYLLLMVGGVGCLTVLIRLLLIHVTSHARYESMWYLEWIFFRFLESSFLIVFIVQACHLFNIDPTTEPDPKQCVENFYNVALWINYVSITLVTTHIFVYFIKIWLNYVSRWIFRHI